MTWMVYGANGYTGQLIARLANQRGEKPILAGRSAERIAPLAAELDCPHVVVDLDNRRALRAALAEVDVVAHCAGPFSRTWEAMVDACLDTTTHYLDITGEIDVFEAIYARADEAVDAEVVLLPGAGFDVVPSDCLAGMLAQRLPDAVELELAFTLGGGISGGTLKTVIEGAGIGGRARVDGELMSVGMGHRQRVADFPSGPKRVTAVPWPDVSSAYRSTGIRTITTYTVVPGGDLLGRGQQLLGPLLRLPAVQRAGAQLVDKLMRGPSEDRQLQGRAEFWGRVRDDEGRAVAGTLTTPAAYTFTADAVLHAVRKLLAGGVPAGAHTPATAFGPDFVTELDGVEVGNGGHAADQPVTEQPATEQPAGDQPESGSASPVDQPGQ